MESNEPESEMDMFLMDVDEAHEVDFDHADSVNRASSSLSRNSNVMDESLDRHVEKMTEELLAEKHVPENNEAGSAGSSRSLQRVRPRIVAGAAVGAAEPTKRVTRQRK